MYLHYTGKRGDLPEYGSDEHLFLIACTHETPELWEMFASMTEKEVQAIVNSLCSLGWGFYFVTVH